MTASIVTAVIALKIADGFLCSYKAIIEEIVTNNFPINKLYFKDHWSYTKTVDTFKVMLDDTRADFVCGLPYQLSIQEGLLFPEDVESDMLESDFNEIKWSINISVLLKPTEPAAYGGVALCNANRETLSVYTYDNPVPSRIFAEGATTIERAAV